MASASVNSSGLAPGQSCGQRGLLWPLLACLLPLLASLCGCTSLPEYIHNGFKVGPNYSPPPAPVAKDWIEADDLRKRNPADDISKWWTVFNDPTLDRLICFAYNQNLTLRQAGFRILEARAQRGIAVGNFFPQTSQAVGDYERFARSRETALSRISSAQFYSQWDMGFNLNWELDFWGRYRRAIESTSATLDASVADYDDVLVTLLGDVATNYVQMRTTEQRIKYVRANIDIQAKTLKIATAQFRGGAVTELDVDQAQTLLKQTEATIPELEIALRQLTNQLCILLGIPPEELRQKLGEGPIPSADPQVALGTGIPADLLRRRPDIRKAERTAAAQCAQIGVAVSDFYPHIILVGDFTYSAREFGHMFRPTALNGNFGPTFQWNVLQSGRILNNVRLQKARFGELITAYQNTVLNAQKEVENGLITYLKAQERTKLQIESVQYAEKAVKVVMAQYVGGLVDFTRITQLQQILVQQQDVLAQAQGEISTGLIQVYKALGGGWEMRLTGCDPDGCAVAPSEAPVKFLDPRTPIDLPPPRPVPETISQPEAPALEEKMQAPATKDARMLLQEISAR